MIYQQTVLLQYHLQINTPDSLLAKNNAMLFQQDFESGIPSGIKVQTKWNVEVEDSGNHVYCNNALVLQRKVESKKTG